MAVKTSDGDRPWRHQADQIKALKAEGLRVCSWSYNYGDNIEGEAAATAYALLAGSDGHIFDIEAEFSRQPDPNDRAAMLVHLVRESFRDTPLAYAPLPVVDNFPTLPYEAFHGLGLPAMPQFYTKALGDTNYPLSRLVKIWESWQRQWRFPAPAIYPVLQGYGQQTADNLVVELSSARALYPGLSLWRFDTITEQMWGVL